PDLTYADLAPCLILISLGYAFTLTTAAAFMSTNVARNDNKARAMGSIYARYVLGSFATYAIFTNWLYRGTRHHFSRLSEHINAANPFFSRQFKMISGAFKSHSGDLYSAQRQALQLLAHKTELQPMLVTLLDIKIG